MTAWTSQCASQSLELAFKSAALFVSATVVFDGIHYLLHRGQSSGWPWMRRLAALHQAHHDFCDRSLVYHKEEVGRNLVRHVLPEYASQMAVCALGFAILDPAPVAAVMAVFTAIFAAVLILRGNDRNHSASADVPAAHGTVLVRAAYHALHHVYPECYLGSYTTLFDRLMGTACQVRGRRFALTGASGAFGSALKSLLEGAGAEVVPLKYGLDYTDDDYSGTNLALARADVLVLAHGTRDTAAMRVNCESFLALIERFKRLTQHRLVPAEVWAVGSEIECHPTCGVPELQAYASSKRAFARAAARLYYDPKVLYRHIVPSAFRSRMGPGLMSAHTAARVALWLIRHGFRYVPVTYTGIAYLNYVPFYLRALLGARNPGTPATRRKQGASISAVFGSAGPVAGAQGRI